MTVIQGRMCMDMAGVRKMTVSGVKERSIWEEEAFELNLSTRRGFAFSRIDDTPIFL